VKLYEIDQRITECFDAETGEVLDEEKLNVLEMERSKKLENVACYIKDLKADIEAIKTEEKTLAQRRKTLEHKVDGLKNWLFFALDGQKLTTPKCAVSYRHSQSIEVPDLKKLDPEFIHYQQSADKTAIKKRIKEGFDVTGAELVDKLNLVIK
jgi:hypothetical protein